MTLLAIEPRRSAIAPSSARRAPSLRPARMATAALVAMVVLLSGSVLLGLGIPYGSQPGPIFAKIHPATYWSIVTVVLWGMARGGVGRLVASTAIERPGAMLFGFGIALVLFHAAVVVKLPLAPVIDTFVLPLALFVALLQLDRLDRRRLELALHAVMGLNAAIGLVEYASGWRLTPIFDPDGSMLTFDWRSSALFGHPLTNAFVTGNYVVALAFGASPRLPAGLRLGLGSLNALALIAFGGRVAMVLAGMMAVFALGLGALRLMVGRRFALRDAVSAIAFVTVGVVLLVLLIDAGGADRFLARFSDDQGSAQSRVNMFRVFGVLSWEQFLFWPDADAVGQAQRDFSLRIGIESSEIGFAASYGVVITVVFFATLAAFLRDVVRATSPRAWWSVLYFVGVTAASIGIATKTTMLSLFVVSTFALMRDEDAGPPRRAHDPAPPPC